MAEREDHSYKFAAMFGADVHARVEDFHEYSKLSATIDRAFTRRVGMFLSAPPVRALAVQAWREFAGYPQVALPADASLGSMTLEQALQRRRSLVNEEGTDAQRLDVGRLAAILRHSYGETGSLSTGPHSPPQPLRATCSAGALYPLEIYPIVFDVDGLDPGVYHYHVRAHALEVLRAGPQRAGFLAAMQVQPMCHTASCIVVITAVLERTLSKYLHRGYRFVMNDCGALLQSLYLTSTALSVPASAWGGFCDDDLARFIGVDGLDEVVAMAFVLGQDRQARGG